MTGRLFLVRHGQTAWNATGRAQGQTEVPLDEVGRSQASRAAAHLARLTKAHGPGAVWSSDLGRCRETARLIADAMGLEASFHRELRERAFGAWEGDPLADIRLRLEAQSLATGLPLSSQRPPGGESHDDVWERIAPTVEQIRGTLTSGVKCLVIVSHGGLVATMLARLMGGSLETPRSFRLRNASVTELEARADGVFQLHRFDDVSHL